MSARRARWARPQIVSVPVPVVEELLAVGYRKKAERWAEVAKARRLLASA